MRIKFLIMAYLLVQNMNGLAMDKSAMTPLEKEHVELRFRNSLGYKFYITKCIKKNQWFGYLATDINSVTTVVTEEKGPNGNYYTATFVEESSTQGEDYKPLPKGLFNVVDILCANPKEPEKYNNSNTVSVTRDYYTKRLKIDLGTRYEDYNEKDFSKWPSKKLKNAFQNQRGWPKKSQLEQKQKYSGYDGGYTAVETQASQTSQEKIKRPEPALEQHASKDQPEKSQSSIAAWYAWFMNNNNQ